MAWFVGDTRWVWTVWLWDDGRSLLGDNEVGVVLAEGDREGVMGSGCGTNEASVEYVIIKACSCCHGNNWHMRYLDYYDVCIVELLKLIFHYNTRVCLRLLANGLYCVEHLGLSVVECWGEAFHS